MPDSGWDALAQLPSDAEPDDVLNAARADIEALGERLQREYMTALRFAVADVDLRVNPAKLVVTVESATGRRTIQLSAQVILVSFGKGVGPLGLLAYGLVARDPLDGTWRPKRIGQAFLPSGEQLTARSEVYRHTSESDIVGDELGIGHNVLVTGDHGSGRSALAAHFAMKYKDNRRGVIWLNPTDPADGPESIVLTLLQLEQAKDYLLVIDGLDANLPVARAVFDCVRQLQSTFGLTIQVLATGVISLERSLTQGEWTIELAPVRLDGAATVRQMLDDITDGSIEARDRIEALAGNDVHIAADAVAFYEARRRVPTESDLQQKYTGDTQDPQEQRALYHLSCLGVLGLAMGSGEAERRFNDSVEHLRAANLVHRADDGYTIGPRRRAQLVMQHALTHWPAASSDKPEAIIWRHLQLGGGRAIRAMLSQIDQIVATESLGPDSVFLLTTWDMLERFASSLERRVDADPTWQDNLGAAVFAAIALTRMRPDDRNRWKAIVDPIRARWRCDSTLILPEYVGVPTADAADFREIAEQMAVEDQLFGPLGHPYGMKAGDFVEDKAYRSWVLGLLLGLEGTAPADLRDRYRINQLVAMAARAQEDGGYFYPRRIPWVTARVVIGLCQAGQFTNNNPVVAEACRWLRSLVGDQDPRALWWRSGTGSWNSDEATTAMCLTALHMAGERNRPSMSAATEWLESRDEEWTLPNREIDLANVLETLTLRRQSRIQPHLMTLFGRLDSELRSSTSDRSRPEERLRVPFITSQLANIVWQTVRTEYRKLLKDVMSRHPDDAPHDETVDQTIDQTIDIAVPPAALVCGLSPRQLRLWRDATTQLSNHLLEQITIRAKVKAPTVQRKFDDFVAKRDQLQRLTGELHESSPRTVLEGIDGLGRSVLDRAWPMLPFPDVYCDEVPGHGDKADPDSEERE